MALVRPDRQGRDPTVGIRLHDRVKEIWRKVLALRYHPFEHVSDKPLI